METIVSKEYQKLIDQLKEVRKANLMECDTLLPDNVEKFRNITNEMAKTYAAKNHDYGNSFEQSLDEFGLVASVVRLGDKMNRIKSLIKKEAKVKDESIKDTLLDLASYSVMALMWLNKQQK